jgi:hypothetical protein
MWKEIGLKATPPPLVRFPELVVVAVARETDSCTRLAQFRLRSDRGFSPEYRLVSARHSDCGGLGITWFIAALSRERLPDRFWVPEPYPGTDRIWFTRDLAGEVEPAR